MPLTITSDVFSNFSLSTIAGGAGGIGTPLNSGDTSLVLQAATGAKFPATGPFRLVINPGQANAEVVTVTGRTVDTLTGLARAQEGTAANQWQPGTACQHVLTAGNMGNVWSAIQALVVAVNTVGGGSFTAPLDLTVTVPGSGINPALGGLVSGDTVARVEMGVDSTGYGRLSAGHGTSLTADLIANSTGWHIPQALLADGVITTNNALAVNANGRGGVFTLFSGPGSIKLSVDMGGPSLTVEGGWALAMHGGVGVTITSDSTYNISLNTGNIVGVTGSVVLSSGTFVTSQSGSAAVLASSGTITTSGVGAARVAPAGAVTGVILQAGTTGGQTVCVVNESAFSVTFAASGTSHVADGVSDVIAANTARKYIWDSGVSLWFALI